MVANLNQINNSQIKLSSQNLLIIFPPLSYTLANYWVGAPSLKLHFFAEFLAHCAYLHSTSTHTHYLV